MLKQLEKLSAFIGNTPLIELKNEHSHLYAKLEYNNFSGSSKDRAAYSILYNGILSGTGVSGMLRALEQAWGRDPETMIPDVRFTPNPHDAPNGPLGERGE